MSIERFVFRLWGSEAGQPHGRRTVPRSRSRSRSGRGRSGFTIIEVIVAVMILVIGVLGLASSSAVVSRMIGGGAQQALAANVAQTRFERLRAIQCASVANGTATSRGVTESWTVQQVAARQYFVSVSITYTTPGGARTPQPYEGYITCRP